MKRLSLFICILCLVAYSCTTRKDGSIRYRTTSESMLPTISPGDYLLMDTTERKFQLDYGDIIRCSFNVSDEKDYDIFRIIGLPGDSVAVYDEFTVINGNMCKHKFIRNAQHDIFKFREFEEILPNKKVISIYKSELDIKTDRDYYPTIEVPKDCYFVLGDSRSLCIDGRFIGFIPQENIWGKLIKIDN